MKKRLFPLCVALLLSLAACNPKQTPSPAPTPTPSLVIANDPAVRTDWSKLGDKPQPLPEVGGRWYEDYTPALIPRDDYGPLIPYAGLRLHDNWPSNTGCLYGLMTKDGVAVTDAVYSSVYRPSCYDGFDRAYHPLLALLKGGETRNIAIAAADGSWCTDFIYSGIKSSPNGLLLLQPDNLTLMEPDGTVLHHYTVAELGLNEEDFKDLHSDVHWFEGVGGEWIGDYASLIWADETATAVHLLRVSTGERVTMSFDEWNAYQAEQFPPQKGGPPVTWDTEGPPFDQYSDVSIVYDSLLGYNVPYLLAAQMADGDGTVTDYYRTDGVLLLHQRPMLGNAWYQQTQLIGGLLEVLDLNMASYYDIDTLDCVFRTYLGFEGD